MALSKPFAEKGNKVSIALEKTDDGVMNYEEGFGARYEQPIKAVIDEKGNIVSTGGLQITRPQFNGLMNDLSKAIIENQEKIIANFQHITKVENTMSGCAFLEKDNTFKGVIKFNENPTLENELPYSAAASNALITKNAFESKVINESVAYSAQGNDLIVTKGALEKQLIDLKKIISAAIAGNIVVGNASFDTLKVKHLIVSSGANVISASANTATTTTFTDSGLHLVKLKNFKN